MSFLFGGSSKLKSLFVSPVSQSYIQQTLRFATKKTGGSTRNGRDSIGRRLGVKKFGGEYVITGNIVIRQRGVRYRPGANIGVGKDHTLYALTPGYVQFNYNEKIKRQIVSIVEQNPNPPPYVPKLKKWQIPRVLPAVKAEEAASVTVSA